MIGVEHGDAGRQLIERAAVRIGQPRERVAHRFRFGGVDADAGAAGLGTKVEHIEGAPAAGDDRGKPAGVGAALQARPRDVVARGAVEQFHALRRTTAIVSASTARA